jgi:uncharacterized Zn-binding protein involved in type VI secretion
LAVGESEASRMPTLPKRYMKIAAGSTSFMVNGIEARIVTL